MPLSNELSLRPTQSSQSDPVRSLDLTVFDLRLDRFRLVQPKAEQLIRRSLAKYGQLAPVVFWGRSVGRSVGAICGGDLWGQTLFTVFEAIPRTICGVRPEWHC